jgi:aspartate racemase
LRKIGVIGGNGVAATNKLNELIENKLTKEGAFRDFHHPEIIIYQATQSPSRSMFLEGKGESFIDDYVSIAKKLKQAGAEEICICCNTAHYAIDEISEKAGIPFINLISEVVKKVPGRGINIGLIASNGCLKGKVYEKYFSALSPPPPPPRLNIIYPDEKFQKEVTRGICNIKNSCRFLPKNHPDRPFSIFKEVCKHLFDRDAHIIIIGCTDIRVDFKSKNTIDSLEVLAQCVIDKSMNRK